VLIADVVSRAIITGGGVGTILAVLGVCLFLVWVALPLFSSATMGDRRQFAVSPAGTPLAVGIDEYQVLGWTLTADGKFSSLELASGAVLGEKRITGNRSITACGLRPGGTKAVLGFADGTVQLVEVRFQSSFVPEQEIPADTREKLRVASQTGTPWKGGVLQLTPEGQYRWQRADVEAGPEVAISTNSVVLVQRIERSGGELVCALVREGPGFALRAVIGTEKQSFLTGASSFAFGKPLDLPLKMLSPDAPAFLALSAGGSDAYVAWRSGDILRLRTSSPEAAYISEEGRLLEGNAELTSLSFMLGDTTLIWSDSRGGVYGGFLVRISEMPEGRGIPGAVRNGEAALHGLALAKTLRKSGPALTSMAPSSRSRLILCGFKDGSVRLFNVTSESLLGEFRLAEGTPIEHLLISPKEDGMLALSGGNLIHASIHPGYPEASFKALFRPVWYEGYARPQSIWQSSSATDDFEPKLGLMPLIFGTLKATLYSMLFGAPLALLAAIFSSEFLHPRVKAAVKPTIELMASLPSVVLGFLAALVFAPVVEKWVPSTLTFFFALPLALALAAYLWQLLPQRLTLPLENWRALIMLVPVAAGMAMAVVVGPVVESWLFGGDIKAWLAWEPAPGSGGTLSPYASSVGGWMILLLPLSAILTPLLVGRFVNPALRRLSRKCERETLAVIDVVRFLALSALILGAAWALSALLNAWGCDPRGSYVDTYVQRNSLVVGVVMGFAIIPIIYTISDDALSTVPSHLRGASLGAGATRWQTAVRVVIPTAMSGLFSAMMIGLGRAVGETMIVLMAAGNTPVMSWNIFEGFRTLSANIAVELPEAVKDSTHYRTLFLAALVLFAMTFVVNTVAEMVRLRFRKRAMAL